MPGLPAPRAVAPGGARARAAAPCCVVVPPGAARDATGAVKHRKLEFRVAHADQREKAALG